VFSGALSLPRHAFSPRETARAGDLWRACQEVAVMASSAAGWPPSRYRDEGNAFVVRSMTVVHHRETVYGEALVGRSWVSRFRREMLSSRQVRIDGEDGAPVVVATQEWAHVSAALVPSRAPASLTGAFPAEPGDGAEAGLPSPAEPSGGASWQIALPIWQLWADPLGHVNHPVYVDFCDEALSRSLRARGELPARLVPVAEEVHFRGGVEPGEVVTVQTAPRGWTALGDAVFAHRILVGERLAATATTVRRLAGETGRSSLFAP
jgi:acyl-CoA thioesterase FadM